MKLRTRITLAMLSLVGLSIVIIGIVSVWFFSEQNVRYHQERLQRKERAIKTEMRYFSERLELSTDSLSSLPILRNELEKLANVHNLIINFYSTTGKLLISAGPKLSSQPLAQKEVPLKALVKLESEDRVVIREDRSGGNYLSDYTKLYDGQKGVIGILHIPYLEDPSIHQQDLEEFLGSIGLVYVFIILGALGLTFILSNSITKNISLLSARLQEVDFNQNNTPIEIQSDDEIGTLVSTYNLMLEKLEESREKLARTERESAWREMAKQVAHEIKNPLTPIKLSVQHLLATASYQDERWQKKFSQTMETIITQIDSLSKIATEFSDFAQMPKSRHEVVNVHDLLLESAQLFSEAPFELRYQPPNDHPLVLGDKDQLRRVFNNILKNAKHAVVEVSNPLVEISLSATPKNVLISFTDNGSGISPDLKNKIFEPNFTTKSSGIGLGLSMCKQIVESCDGRIWFESPEEGTTQFKIDLPRYSADT